MTGVRTGDDRYVIYKDQWHMWDAMQRRWTGSENAATKYSDIDAVAREFANLPGDDVAHARIGILRPVAWELLAGRPLRYLG